MSGPPPGVEGGTKPSPEQIAAFKEAGLRERFTVDLGAAVGPYVMGFVLNYIMLGVLCAQVWHWASWTKKERPFIRIIVWFVLFTSLGSSVFAMTWQYHLFVTEYGRFSQFVDDNWFSWLPIVDHGVITACHVFNLDRAYRLNGKNIWLIVAVVPLMLASFSILIARATIKTAHSFVGSEALKPFIYAYPFSLVAIDTVLTCAIAYGLWKSKTGWKQTDAIIKRVIVYTVETQLLPALAALAMAIQYAINNVTFMAFLYIICQAKIPAVMLMAVLNYRLSLRRDMQTTQHRSTDALVDSGRQETPKGDSASESQSYAMDTINASRSDWQLSDDGTGMQPVKA